MSTGWQSRLEILRRTCDEKILSPLRVHGWTAQIIREVEKGDYLVVEATRASYTHRVALLYSSATDNNIYKQLLPEVDQFFTYGELYKLESFAYGISKPVTRADEFHHLLLKWNKDSAEGKFAPDSDSVSIEAKGELNPDIVSEHPLQAIWLRLRQIESVTLAEKMIETRASAEGKVLDSAIIRSKAEGLAFSVRNGADYFRAGQAQNVTQRILNLYYGVLSFAFAEILASPNGPHALSEAEESTQWGHGLFTLEGKSSELGDMVVGVLSQGFFPKWLKVLGLPMSELPQKRPRRYDELKTEAGSTWNTLEALFGCIPEVADFFLEIFKSAPSHVVPIYDMEANQRPSIRGTERPSSSYIRFYDRSARLKKEDIARLPAPLSEIIEIDSSRGGRTFRAAVDFSGHKMHWDVLSIHHSPFTRQAMILPVFSLMNEYRAICLVILYALSIVVRYRPSVWRRVQEGDLDHMRAMIEAFLEVVERVLPEQFLGSITGRKLRVKQPSQF